MAERSGLYQAVADALFNRRLLPEMVNLRGNLRIAHRGNLASFPASPTSTSHFKPVPQDAALAEWIEQLPATAATYTLCFEIPTEGTVAVGRLGSKHFPAGLYLYVGSARGPGGLRARVRHHRSARRALTGTSITFVVA